MLTLAYENELPIVATNEPFFPTPADFEAHDALMAVAHNAMVSDDRRFRLTEDHYLKSQAEMAELFADLPEALDNTIEIARRSSFILETRQADPAEVRRQFGRPGGNRQGRGPGTQAAGGRGASRAGWRSSVRAPGFTTEDYAGAPRNRTRHHRAHEVSRLLPDRLGLHQMGEGAGHSRRPRARIGRGLSRRLRADGDRHRPVALLAAVRALPQSGARLDAGLRHRLLPGPARGGDPLRPGQVRPPAGRPDHHLRFAAGAGGAARRRPRAGDALRPGRQDLQAGAEQSGQSDAARQGDRGRSEVQRGGRKGAGRRQAARHRAEARGALSPCLDACRRHRDRRPAAVAARADVSGPAFRHARDAVQHEMGRAGRSREVRLPRPEDADRPEDGGRLHRQARRRGRPVGAAARRQADLRDAVARRDGRRVPGRKRRHAQGADRHAAGPHRGHHRAGRPLPAGPDGEHTGLQRPQARRGGDSPRSIRRSTIFWRRRRASSSTRSR